ncbi:hypothetical protein VTG60DRAFT_3505 [Thermothelomyces hinnuleus]
MGLAIEYRHAGLTIGILSKLRAVFVLGHRSVRVSHHREGGLIVDAGWCNCGRSCRRRCRDGPHRHGRLVVHETGEEARPGGCQTRFAVGTFNRDPCVQADLIFYFLNYYKLTEC